MTFRDETVIVTGGARGIGAETARTFAKEGANVVIADLDEETAQETVEDLPGDGDAFAVRTDVSDEDDVDSLVSAVVAEFDGVDVLINNAGIAQEFDPTVSQDVDHWQRILDVNLRGPYICSRAVGPHMLDQERGRIVNVSSLAGTWAASRRTAYCPSKAGVNMLTRTLAVEWADRSVRVNAVAPGFIDTPMHQALREEGRLDEETVVENTPLEEVGRPSDVAEAIRFLASERARYITGVVLPVDGGSSA